VENTIQVLNERSLERDRIETIINNEGMSLRLADTEDSKYIGRVQEVSVHYIAQKVEENILLLHDRAIVKTDVEPSQDVRIAYDQGNVVTSIRPSAENTTWAQSILNTALTIFENARQSDLTTIVSRGIEIFEGNNYNLKLNQNNQVFSIIRKDNSLEIAAFDLDERAVIAANPTESDLSFWLQVTQDRDLDNPPPRKSPRRGR
jgi:hypothetical protein